MDRKNKFIKLSNEKHNNFYKYDKINYINNKTKVIITCPIHGDFEQCPSSHLKGYGCRKCANDKKRLNKDDVLVRLNSIHNNKYKYTDLIFNKNSDKIKIICPVHGEFKQILSDHLSGRGCPVCGGTKPKDIDEFIKNSNHIHDHKYNYTKFNYFNNKTKSIIICPIHGEFKQSPNMHLKGFGCPECKTRKSNTIEYIEKAKIVHNNYYTYNNSNYNGSDHYITITCPIHGDFEQRAAGHLQGFGCNKCNKSKGENKIEKFLIDNNIEYETQKYLNGCDNINKLYFDFYLPLYNLCIEYDGEFHYKKIFENNDINKQIERDNIKNNFCATNNIKLIRISYKNFNDIDKILKDNLFMDNILEQPDPSGKLSKELYLKNNYNELYLDIINYSKLNNIEHISFKEKVYCYKHNIVPPKCSNPNCNNYVKFKNSTIGYKKYCSIKCISSDPVIKDIKKQKSLEKFGTNTPAESDIIKNKIIKTNNYRYGYNCSLQNEKIKEKSKKTLMKNYGVDVPLKSSIIQKKRINNFDVKKWRKKFEKTMIEKYGVKHALQNDDIKEKIKNTNINKYGKDNPNKVKKIIDKRLNSRDENIWQKNLKNTMLDRYGVFNAMDIEKFRKNISLTQRLKEKENNNLILDIDIDNKKYIMKCDCNKDHIFEISFPLYKSRKQFNYKYCTVCYPPYKNNISQLEVDLLNFIKENYNGEIIENSKNIIPPYELDIYLPKLNLAFEFNGVYWHNELNKPNDYHSNKTNLCLEKNIQLIHIYEDDWIYKQEIVKSMILNKLNKTKYKIFARKCQIKEITDNNLIRNFLNFNHIQGFMGSKIKIGLFYNNELVSLMTFGQLRRNMNSKSLNNNEYEMIRFCNRLNTNVIGGASKLFKYFINNYKPEKIISYADRSYSDGSLYKKLEFEMLNITKPNYYYVVDDIRKYRFDFRKDVLIKQGYDKNKSEHDIMLERKIYRIYNSGNYKFLYINKNKI
ncbi:DUF7487 domain-containing protein [Trichloromonas sp.]|uniref:DUF7487 domain-containing protein n=1 Tax=Trichloromonas sp. TaxID=3069249 RepID=UPI002A3ACC02|nr:hypothetical protein [Trichloromonas sp.]